jgi:hypothetical protein
MYIYIYIYIRLFPTPIQFKLVNLELFFNNNYLQTYHEILHVTGASTYL